MIKIRISITTKIETFNMINSSIIMSILRIKATNKTLTIKINSNMINRNKEVLHFINIDKMASRIITITKHMIRIDNNNNSISIKTTIKI